MRRIHTWQCEEQDGRLLPTRFRPSSPSGTSKPNQGYVARAATVSLDYHH